MNAVRHSHRHHVFPAQPYDGLMDMGKAQLSWAVEATPAKLVCTAGRRVRSLLG